MNKRIAKKIIKLANNGYSQKQTLLAYNRLYGNEVVLNIKQGLITISEATGFPIKNFGIGCRI